MKTTGRLLTDKERKQVRNSNNMDLPTPAEWEKARATTQKSISLRVQGFHEKDSKRDLLRMLLSEYVYVLEASEEEAPDFYLYIFCPNSRNMIEHAASIVNTSHTVPEKTLMLILDSDGGRSWLGFEMQPIIRVGHIVRDNGGKIFTSMTCLSTYLNKMVA